MQQRGFNKLKSRHFFPFDPEEDEEEKAEKEGGEAVGEVRPRRRRLLMRLGRTLHDWGMT